MHTLKFLALSVLTLSVGLAQDHPIIVSNGSPLYIEHDSWKPAGDDHNLGSSVTDHVTRVVIQWGTGSARQKWPRDFNIGERLDLSLTYGTVQLSVDANHDNKGQGINVYTNKSLQNDFTKPSNKKYVRDETSTNATVTNVTVKKNGTDLAAPTVSEPSKITICYGTADNNSPAECQ